MFKSQNLKSNSSGLTMHLQSEMWFQVCGNHKFISSVWGLIAAHFGLPLPGSLGPSDALKCKHGENAQCDAWTGMFDRRCHNSEWVCGFWWTILMIFKRPSTNLKSNNYLPSFCEIITPSAVILLDLACYFTLLLISPSSLQSGNCLVRCLKRDLRHERRYSMDK